MALPKNPQLQLPRLSHGRLPCRPCRPSRGPARPCRRRPPCRGAPKAWPPWCRLMGWAIRKSGEQWRNVERFGDWETEVGIRNKMWDVIFQTLRSHRQDCWYGLSGEKSANMIDNKWGCTFQNLSLTRMRTIGNVCPMRFSEAGSVQCNVPSSDWSPTSAAAFGVFPILFDHLVQGHLHPGQICSMDVRIPRTQPWGYELSPSLERGWRQWDFQQKLRLLVNGLLGPAFQMWGSIMDIMEIGCMCLSFKKCPELEEKCWIRN